MPHRLFGAIGRGTLAVLMFVGNRVFMHYLGDDGVAAFGISCYYIPFVFMAGNATAQSAQPIISYNFGAGLNDRVVTTERIALAVAVACGLTATLLFSVYPHVAVSLFMNHENAAALIATNGFSYFAAGFVCFVVNITAIGYFQSVEKIMPATIFALLRGAIFLAPIFVILPRILGVNGIWLAMPCSEISTSMVIMLFHLSCRRQKA